MVVRWTTTVVVAGVLKLKMDLLVPSFHFHLVAIVVVDFAAVVVVVMVIPIPIDVAVLSVVL